MDEKATKPEKAVTAKKAINEKKAVTEKKPEAPISANASGEAVKAAKPKAPAKSRKSAAPEKTLATVTAIDINREPAATTGSLMGFSAQEVARLAHQYWLERGCQHGHDAEDWFRAEQALRSKAS